jgi:hypothetical protein
MGMMAQLRATGLVDALGADAILLEGEALGDSTRRAVDAAQQWVRLHASPPAA